MISLLILIVLWSFIGLCYLNSLPAYRRRNPCHLPPSSIVQRAGYRLGPFIALILSYICAGVDGLFLWGFSAPLIGVLLGFGIPYHTPKQPQK